MINPFMIILFLVSFAISPKVNAGVLILFGSNQMDGETLRALFQNRLFSKADDFFQIYPNRREIWKMTNDSDLYKKHLNHLIHLSNEEPDIFNAMIDQESPIFIDDQDIEKFKTKIMHSFYTKVSRIADNQAEVLAEMVMQQYSQKKHPSGNAYIKLNEREVLQNLHISDDELQAPWTTEIIQSFCN